MSEGESILLRSFIERRGDWWEAICIDLDITAQGTSLDDAKNLLEDMVVTYLESLADYPPEQRRRFLQRKSPIAVRFSLFWRFFAASLFATPRSRDTVGMIFHQPCPA